MTEYSEYWFLNGKQCWNETHPVWRAINTGGGANCDVKGVLCELDRCGYDVVSRRALEATGKPVDAFK